MTDVKMIFTQHCAKDSHAETQCMAPLTELVYRRIVDLILLTDDRLPDDDGTMKHASKVGAMYKNF